MTLPPFARFDADTGLGNLTTFDPAAIGDPRKDGRAVHFGKLGREITSTADAVKRIARAFGKSHEDWDETKRMDAATDFVTGSLEQVLPASEDVLLGSDKPYIFVPAGGRPVALPRLPKLDIGKRILSYKVRARSGQAKWMDPAHSMRNMERAGYTVEKKENGAHWFGCAWGYNEPETWEADAMDEDVLGEREAASIEALNDFEEEVSSFGDLNKKTPGLFALPSALIMNGGVDFGTGAVTAETQLLVLATADQVYQRHNKEAQATNMIAPNSALATMGNTFIEGTSKTVLEHALPLYPWLRAAVWSNRLGTASPDDASRWVLYQQNPTNLYIELRDTMVFGPFQDYMDMAFVMIRRHGGCVSKMPEEVAYLDFTKS